MLVRVREEVRDGFEEALAFGVVGANAVTQGRFTVPWSGFCIARELPHAHGLFFSRKRFDLDRSARDDGVDELGPLDCPARGLSHEERFRLVLRVGRAKKLGRHGAKPRGKALGFSAGLASASTTPRRSYSRSAHGLRRTPARQTEQTRLFSC